MGLIIVSGEPGIRTAEVARVLRALLAGAQMDCELIDEARLAQLVREEFPGEPLPDRAWGDALGALLVHAAMEHHLLVAVPGGEYLLPRSRAVLRVRLHAPEAARAGMRLLSEGVDQAAARQSLREEALAAKTTRRARFARQPAPVFDLSICAEALTSDQMAELIAHLIRTVGMPGLLAAGDEARLQFEFRLRLARHGITPAGRAPVKRSVFAHKSEEIFANLLDFYRIQWHYEPRSFALSWDRAKQPVEMFTPDFYLPEFDLYVELTTMKQSLATKKNRKVKMLKQIYPEVNIQVFYQRDFQNLIFKHGLPQ